MKYFSYLYRIKFLFGIVCLGLMALMIFQINWIKMSRTMIEEQFDQNVNLAIGSALTDFNEKYDTSLDIDEEQCGDEDNYKYISVENGYLSDDRKAELTESLGIYLGCYGIDEKYNVDIFKEDCTPKGSLFCCSISTKANCKVDYKLGVSFMSRSDYLYDKMKFMILSSILIFILLSTVSFIILNALVQQKRITENNIDFFNNTAHELKTPLTNISLALNLLRKKYTQIEGDRYTQIIKSENSKLSHEIERVLFLSKMESGEYVIKREPIPIQKVLQDVIENMAMIIDQKRGDIKLHMPKEVITIAGDYYHLSNVFRNLIDNALKYCDVEPKIDIVLVEADNQVTVHVKDNGIGISKHDQNLIFEKFQRVNTGNIRETNGFGIGLSYVKTVIEMHKGLINVHSELNKGSRFEVVIPNA